MCKRRRLECLIKRMNSPSTRQYRPKVRGRPRHNKQGNRQSHQTIAHIHRPAHNPRINTSFLHCCEGCVKHSCHQRQYHRKMSARLRAFNRQDPFGQAVKPLSMHWQNLSDRTRRDHQSAPPLQLRGLAEQTYLLMKPIHHPSRCRPTWS